MRVRLKELMQAKGWTAAQAADSLGITLAAVYRLREKPVARLDESTMAAIVTMFGLERIDQLIEADWL